MDCKESRLFCKPVSTAVSGSGKQPLSWRLFSFVRTFFDGVPARTGV